MLLLTQNRQKLEPRAKKCCFLGFKEGTKGFLLLDLETKNVFASRNVVFQENSFPYALDSTSIVPSNAEFSTEPFSKNFFMNLGQRITCILQRHSHMKLWLLHPLITPPVLLILMLLLIITLLVIHLMINLK
jgi:hypothetical protein